METNLNSSLFTEITNSEANSIVGGAASAKAKAHASALGKYYAETKTKTDTTAISEHHFNLAVSGSKSSAYAE